MALPHFHYGVFHECQDGFHHVLPHLHADLGSVQATMPPRIVHMFHFCARTCAQVVTPLSIASENN